MRKASGNVIKRGGYSERIAVIDYLKAVCIVFVICNHSGLFDKTKPIFLLSIDKAVPIFMLLSGYVLAIGAGSGAAKELYRASRLLRKLLRYTVPVLIAFSLWLMLKCISGDTLSLYEMIKCFCLGRYGQGSYYYPLMLQFLLLSPILFWSVERLGFHGVVFAGLCNFYFDICSSTYMLRTSLYRVLIFRYLLAITLGIYLGRHRDIKIGNRDMVLMLAVGIGYILLPSYWGYDYKIYTFEPWRRTSMISLLYVFPVVYMIIRHCEQYRSRTVIGKTVELVGRASYHIMYTQMIYYEVRSVFDKIIFDVTRLGIVGELSFNIFVSLASGGLFWYLDERYLTGKLVRLWKKITII